MQRKEKSERMGCDGTVKKYSASICSTTHEKALTRVIVNRER